MQLYARFLYMLQYILHEIDIDIYHIWFIIYTYNILNFKYIHLFIRTEMILILFSTF